MAQTKEARKQSIAKARRAHHGAQIAVKARLDTNVQEGTKQGLQEIKSVMPEIKNEGQAVDLAVKLALELLRENSIVEETHHDDPAAVKARLDTYVQEETKQGLKEMKSLVPEIRNEGQAVDFAVRLALEILRKNVIVETHHDAPITVKAQLDIDVQEETKQGLKEIKSLVPEIRDEGQAVDLAVKLALEILREKKPRQNDEA